MKIYIAAASSEIDRAEKWIKRCQEVGIEVTSTWCATVRKAGAANPADADQLQRRIWATQDLKEVGQADALWFLLPGVGHQTDGAWGELCFAFAKDKWIVLSGKHHSIFTGLATMIRENDEDAFKEIRARAGQ